MTATAPASGRRGPRRSAGSPRAAGCGSQCRPSPTPILPTCSLGQPMRRSPRRAMSPPDNTAGIRRIIGDAEEVLPRLRPLSAAEFLSLELPPRELILDPWLPQKGLVMVHSPRGVGKTHFGLSVAYAVAAGAGFLGFQAPVPRRVIFVDGEMPAATMQRRLAVIVEGFAWQPPEPSYLKILSSDTTEGGLPDLGSA